MDIAKAPPAGVRKGAGYSTKVAGSLTAVTFVTMLSGLLTGPLLGHALGATGRGLLASVLVPLGVAPFIAQLGLGLWAVRAAARDVPVERIVGTLAIPLLIVGGLVALVSGPLAEALLPEDESAQLSLRIGLALLPVGLLVNVMSDVMWGRQRWRPIIIVRLISPVGLLIATPILYVTESLTVTTAAALSIGLGLLPLPLLVALLPAARRPRADRRLMREALGFGLRAWPGTLADLANQRLDQLLMIPLLPPRELGLYAVATTVAVAGTAPAGAISSMVFPRVAAGDLPVIAPAFRTTALILVFTQGAIALTSPFVIPFLFGASFRDAVPLILILLPAWLVTALTPILAHALAGSGHPGPASAAQLVGLACTAVGLAITLPSLGATGAAITSVVAASVVLAYLVRSARRHLPVSARDLLVPRAGDLARAWRGVRAAVSSLRH